MSYKKIYILFSIIILFSCSLSKNEEITFWAMPNAPKEIHAAWMKQKAAEFKEKTGITVRFEEVGWGDAWSRIAQALETGEGVDVFQVGTTWNPQFAATGGLMKLNINKFGGKNAFMKANLVSCTYKGKYYGVPWFAETRCLFYNKDIFNEAGVNPPKTYDELWKIGEKIIDKKGQGTAIAVAGTTAWDLLHNWAIILWANGGDILNEDLTEAVFNSSEGVDSMNYYRNYTGFGLADYDCESYNQPQVDSAFINGEVAMCFMGPWNIEGIKNENPDLNYGVLEPPGGAKRRASFSGGSNLVILEKSNHKVSSQKWIKFLTESGNMADYTKNLSHMLPVKMKAFDDPYYKTENFKVFKKTLSYATPYPPLGVWGDIECAIVDEFKNILSDYIGGRYTEDTVQLYLDKAARKVNDVLEEEYQ